MELQLEDLPNEIWIDCIGYDGIYQVSNLGRIKGVERWRETRPGVGYMMKEKIRKQSVSEKHSWIRCFLCKDGVVKPQMTSRLVFFSFNYNIKNLPEYFVMHKDNDWRNNNIDNLRIGTKNEISKLTFEHGKTEHLKLGNPMLSNYKIENAIYNDKVITDLKCIKCNETKHISKYRKGRNNCKECEIKSRDFMDKRLIKFMNTNFKKTDYKTKEQVIYNKINKEDLLKIVSIGTVLKYCKSKEFCNPTNRSKYKFNPFTIEIVD